MSIGIPNLKIKLKNIKKKTSIPFAPLANPQEQIMKVWLR